MYQPSGIRNEAIALLDIVQCRFYAEIWGACCRAILQKYAVISETSRVLQCMHDTLIEIYPGKQHRLNIEIA
ncbi:hypothetical protein D3C78_1946000 [compost metagenome]